MLFRFDWKKFLSSLLIPIIIGGISAFIIRDSTDIYPTLERPPLSPPPWLFPVAWTVLYILMGISLYLIRVNNTVYEKRTAYILFAVQLFLNFIWSPIFFVGERYLLSLLVLIALVIITAAMIVSFYKISKPAALLQIPYFIWLCFAGYLNSGIYILN